MTQSSESQVVARERCPNPGCDVVGGDNLAVYADGGKYCHACGEVGGKPWKLCGDIVDMMETRKLSLETCKFADVRVGKYTGYIGQGKEAEYLKDGWVKIFPYMDNKGKLVRQKIKTISKKSKFLGPTGQDIPLFLQWKWQPNPKLFITITEGEEDAMAVAQACGYQFPVVSVPMGAGGALKAIKTHLRWLLGFKYVILGFDNDDAGRLAAEKCADLFEPGQVRIATWPNAKDANDLIKAGKGVDIKNALFNAKPLNPDHIVTVSDIIDKVLERPQYGKPYPWRSLDDITYGFQSKEIHVIVGANGIGKTEYVKELMFHYIDKGLKVGLFSFEQNPDNTVRRLIGAKVGRKLHLPGAEWDDINVKELAMELNNKIFLYDKAGSADTESVFRSIRYMARAENVKVIVIDNLKGLCAGKTFDDVKNMMTRIQTLKNELDITIILLSHVSKDKYTYQAYVSTSPKNIDLTQSQTAEDIEALVKKPGMEWESGRMPSKENVEGSSAVTDLADYVFALARDTTSDDPQEQRTLRVKCLKARLDGSKTGKTFKLYYNNSGTYEEVGHVIDNIGGAF